MWKKDNTTVKVIAFLCGLVLVHALAAKADAALEGREDIEYCAMVRTYDDSNGVFGWEPYQGRDMCKQVFEQCAVMVGAEWAKGVPYLENLEWQCSWYHWYLAGGANDNNEE